MEIIGVRGSQCHFFFLHAQQCIQKRFEPILIFLWKSVFHFWGWEHVCRTSYTLTFNYILCCSICLSSTIKISSFFAFVDLNTFSKVSGSILYFLVTYILIMERNCIGPKKSLGPTWINKEEYRRTKSIELKIMVQPLPTCTMDLNLIFKFWHIPASQLERTPIVDRLMFQVSHKYSLLQDSNALFRNLICLLLGQRTWEIIFAFFALHHTSTRLNFLLCATWQMASQVI